MTHLGNAYFLAGDLSGAAESYKRALEDDPKNQHADNNLKVVLNKARAEGRLTILPSMAGPTGLPAFSIAPSK